MTGSSKKPTTTKKTEDQAFHIKKGEKGYGFVEIMLRTIFALSAQQAFFQAILMSSITFSFDAREACSSQMRSAAVLINVSTCGRGEPTAVSRDPLPARGLQQDVTTQSHFQLKFNPSSQVNGAPQEPSSTANSGGTFTASPPDMEWWQ